MLAGRFDSKYDDLLALTTDLKLQENIIFLGWVDDIPGLLSAVDICVFSSLTEGSPNGVLESMAAGLVHSARIISCLLKILSFLQL